MRANSAVLSCAFWVAIRAKYDGNATQNAQEPLLAVEWSVGRSATWQSVSKIDTSPDHAEDGVGHTGAGVLVGALDQRQVPRPKCVVRSVSASEPL